MNATRHAWLLMTPTRHELIPIAKRLSMQPLELSLFEGECEGQRVVGTHTGVGAERVIQSATRVLASYPATDIVLVGFAGGLDPMLGVGHVEEFRRFVSENGEAIELPAIYATSPATPPLSLLTVDRVVSTPQEKAALFHQHKARMVDMESYGVARWAVAHSYPLRVIRVVSDGANHTLPAETADWVTAEGRTKTLSAALHALRHPGAIPSLIELGRNAQLAGDALARRISDQVRASR